MARIGNHAIVIGASMAGLMAARTLGDFYEEVTVVERDALSGANGPRKGVPQGRHAHALLASGCRILEGMFPAFANDILVEGGLAADVGNDVTWRNFGCFLRDDRCGIEGFVISRPTLENAVRRRVAQMPNVQILSSTEAVAPEYDSSRGRVTGLRLRPARSNEESRTLDADLVVDASGRGSRSPVWLEGWGFSKPEDEAVGVEIGYMTRHYRRRPDQLPAKRAVVLAAAHPDWRAGVIVAQDGGRWVVTMGGYFGDRAPSDDQGFLAYARSLPGPEIYDVIKDAEPLDDPTPYHFPSSLRRRYERLARFPEGYLAFGDALCSFNPIYGQGMSVAAMEAVALRETLEKGPDALARRFFAAAAKVIDTPWQMAVGADLAHPKVEGPRPLPVRFINWYVRKLFQAGARDPIVAKRFIEVANLLRPPPALMNPSIAWRVWRAHAFA